MRTSVLLWSAAALITLSALVYQRMVGPTRPSRGQVEVAGETVRFKLRRSAGGRGDHPVTVTVPDPALAGVLEFRRHKTDDPWSRRTMTARARPDGGVELTGLLPRQPRGGKVAYRVHLVPRAAAEARADGLSPIEPAAAPPPEGDWTPPAGSVALPPDGPLVLRFRGHVPRSLLVPHVVLMFMGMLWSNRAGLEALRRRGNPLGATLWSLLLLGAGGLVLGPAVQWHAFGEAWTGAPFGWDLTDNKTLIAFVAWGAALLATRRAAHRGRPQAARGWVLAAALVTLVIFSIPHSVLGTELDYTSGKRIIAR